jgi:hypothetical protein
MGSMLITLTLLKFSPELFANRLNSKIVQKLITWNGFGA